MKTKSYILIILIAIMIAGCDIQIEIELPTAPPSAETNTDTAAPTAVEETHTDTPAVSGPTFMDKVSPDDIRLLSYNVNWDSIFPDDDRNNHSYREENSTAEFRRLIAAISPDIACIQEINPSRDASDVSAIFDEVLPLENGAKWNAISGRDNVIVSKYNLLTDGYELVSTKPGLPVLQASALVDLPDNLYSETDLFLICSHFKASGGDSNVQTRQFQADFIIQTVGDLKTPGDNIDLAENTPFVFAGDFNAYDTDPAYHVETLITGDIVYEDYFGSDLEPDWDDTWLADALPSHQGEGEFFYTWRDDSDKFNPGPLDRIVYTDSVMSIHNSFILNTTELSPELLALFNLEANDVMLDPAEGVYDHLPVVVDFTFQGE